LNHFIFVSSSPSECAEVRANASGVTVAQLPADTQQIPHFLSHFWPFDDWPTTGQAEAKSFTRAERFVEIATRLSTVDAVSEAIESEKVRHSTGRAAYAPPRTGIEELLVDVWARLLRVEQPGIRDNFFALGGHSLLAVQVIARIRQILGVEMPLRAMFDAPTIAEFAQRMEAARGTRGESAIPALTPAPRQGPIPLSFSNWNREIRCTTFLRCTACGARSMSKPCRRRSTKLCAVMSRCARRSRAWTEIPSK
jgi:acyl carrier protein